MPLGQLTFEVAHPWFARKEATVTVPSAPIDIVLSHGASWAGRALGPDAPLAGARLSFSDAAGRSETLTVPADGAFSFRGLSAGEAKITISLGDESPLGRRRFVVRQTFDTSQALEANVTLTTAGIISGRVVGLDAGMFTAKYVEAVPDDGSVFFYENHPEKVTVKIGAGGQFVFRALAPGAWRLRGWAMQSFVLAKTGSTDVVVPAR